MAEDTSFFQKVYQIVRQIPYGKVTSYGAIAKVLGSPQSSRMVGWAMNASHSLVDVPAHRVVNRNGLLTGKMHFDGTNLMQQLLESEGIVVIDNQIQHFEAVFWKPHPNPPHLPAGRQEGEGTETGKLNFRYKEI